MHHFPTRRLLLVAGCLVILAVVGSAIGHREQRPAPEAPPTAAAGAWHIVQPGENLRVLARHYFGSSRCWRTLQVVNDVGMYPKVGTRLYIGSGDLSLLGTDEGALAHLE